MRKYVIMGGPGCGKGTQAKLLADQHQLAHISVGEMLRWHIQSHTKLAARIKQIVNAGELAPDELVEEVVQDRLQKHDTEVGFLLDGFPRNAAQANFLLDHYEIDAAILLTASDEVIMERVLARRLCSQCGLDYNLIHHRPAVDGVCDVCDGALIARADDFEEAVRARVHDFHAQTEPVIELFASRQLVVQIDAMQSIEQVNDQINDRLNLPRANRVRIAQ